MKKITLLFLIFAIPYVVFAQTTQEKKIYNENGEVIKLVKTTRIDEQKEAVEITSYHEDNRAQIADVKQYIAVKRAAGEPRESNDLIEKIAPVLGELLKTANVYVHGQSVAYFPNGKPEYVRHYAYGTLQGEEIKYDAEGNILSKGNYSQDKKEGEEITYDTEGNILSKGNYFQGKKEGEWIVYFVTDNKYYRKGRYKNGKKQGVWGTYLANGTLVTDEKFIEGKLDENFEPSIKVPTTNYDAKRKLRGLCTFVGSYTKDSNPQGKYIYLYQRRILEAANVNLNIESEETIAMKVSKVWKENEDMLICNNTQFDVSNGSLIKYAVAMRFDHFLFDMTAWKVNLNKVDETDGKTVLDYVKYQLDGAKGTAMEVTLDRYYHLLRRAGAKHKSEL